MIDIKIIREDKEKVINNLKKKFQEEKIPMLDEILALDEKRRNNQTKGDELRKKRKDLSDEIGALFKDKKVDEANKKKEEVTNINKEIEDLESEEATLAEDLKKLMYSIPNIIWKRQVLPLR